MAAAVPVTGPVGGDSDWEVVVSVRGERGDLEQRFTAFFTAVFPRLTGYCAGLVGGVEEGADIAQEALVRTYSRWAAVREPKAYAYLVATNLARRAWRQRQREQQAFAVLAQPALVVGAPDPEVLDAVRRLPDHLRVVVLLHYYADLPLEQIARTLNRPAGTVRRRLFDARAQLAHDLTMETYHDNA